MTRTAKAGACLLLAGCLLPAQLAGQQIVPTDTAGVYTLSYTDIDGNAHTVRVEAPNRTDPEIIVRTSQIPTGHRMEITLRNLVSARARQPILEFELPCPDVTALSAPSGWNARWQHHAARGKICYFSSRQDALAPGEEAGPFVIESPLGPGSSVIRVFGAAEAVLWPSASGTVPDEAFALADQYRGRTGGWLELTGRALVGGDPDPSVVLGEAITLLNAQCEAGGVRPQGVCVSLRAKLVAAREALARGNTTAAVAALGAALHELDALPDSRIDAPVRAALRERIQAALSQLGG